MEMTKNDLNIAWNTEVILAWTQKNYDKILMPTDIVSNETYITIGDQKNKKHINGYELRKRHNGDKFDTIYFVRAEDIKKLDIIVNDGDTINVHCRQKVYKLVTRINSIKIIPERKMSIRQFVKNTGIPYHTSPEDWFNYKTKRLIGRLYKQFYGRYISESGFGKDKSAEGVRMLINHAANISDPTKAKIMMLACNDFRDTCINELGVPEGKTERTKYFNTIMRIAEGTKVLDNSSRATDGTSETAFIDKFSFCMTHNIAEYYIEKHEPFFEQIYPYNVINRIYYNSYNGFCQAESLPNDKTPEELADKYDEFYKDWVKTALWIEENLQKYTNKFKNINLDLLFPFPKKEERFKYHFKTFAHFISFIAKDEKEYLKILKWDYDNHMSYKEKIKTLLKNY